MTETKMITIANIAGGDERRFRGVSDNAIRHARWLDDNRFGGWACDDAAATEEISQILEATVWDS